MLDLHLYDSDDAAKMCEEKLIEIRCDPELFR